MITEPEKAGEEARVIWLPSGTMVDIYGKLAKGGHRPTYANVRSFLSEMPNVPGYDQGVFLRGGKVEYGPAKPQAPKAGFGTGWERLDTLFGGGGNALMGGLHSVLGAFEGWNMKKALDNQISFGQAKLPENVRAVTRESRAQAEIPHEDPATVLAELLASQGGREGYSQGEWMDGGPGIIAGATSGSRYTKDVAKKNPRYLAAVQAQEAKEKRAEQEQDAEDKIVEQQKLRQRGYDMVVSKPITGAEMERRRNGGKGLGDLASRPLELHRGLDRVSAWSWSLTPEQRASLTPDQIRAKVDELLQGSIDESVLSTASDLAKRDEKIRYWDVKSPELELYNKPGKNYDDVNEQGGPRGVFNVLWQQLMSSVPNTGATMAATTAATVASGPAAPVAGPAAMAASTALLETGTGFNQAFGTWLAKQGIDLNDIRDPKSKEYAAAMAKLKAITDKDPVGVMGQMQEMLNASGKRGAISGGTAAVLNVAGNRVQDLAKSALPKSYNAPMTDGSLVKPIAAAIYSPVRTAQVYRKIIFPRAAKAGIDTAWEATEEALTDIITDVLMGESPDKKTALSSFLVGAKMGGISSFGFGKSNVDNPFEILRKAAEEGESGLDRVAAEIELNTGMPAAKAKASIQKAGEILEQFETFAKRYPPTPEFRKRAWADFIKGYRGNRDALYSHEQDTLRARIKDRQTDLDALNAELEQRRLMAFNPNNVPVSPLIPSLQKEVDELKQGFDYTRGEGRYFHPLTQTPDADPPKK